LLPQPASNSAASEKARMQWIGRSMAIPGRAMDDGPKYNGAGDGAAPKVTGMALCVKHCTELTTADRC
jgi:hypothetical protein